MSDRHGFFAGASEDRPPRVLSRITPPVLAGCARAGGPIRATRGGKPSEEERWTRDGPTTRPATMVPLVTVPHVW